MVAVRVAEGDSDDAIDTYLQQRVHRFAEVASYRLLSLRGDAGGEITAVATATPDSMIVMATHGRGGLGRMLLGSVAEAVLKASANPVLLVGEHCRTVP